VSEAVLDVEASKAYPGCRVLERARLVVRPRTIHALVGENGAGKSTLVTIAAGLLRADAGHVRATVPVGLVPQHGALVPTLTIVENAVLGREPTRFGLLELAPVADKLRAVGIEHGLAIDPYAIAGSLSVGERQRAEIVIALWRGADLLMLDEPTAVLAPVEVAGLFAVLRRHVEGGGAVVIVTHKLDEVVAIADDVTVLRAGEVVDTITGRGSFDADRIARAMVGGDPPGRAVPPPAPVAREVALAVRGLSVERVAGIELEVGAGEVVGIAGVEGNGQRELVLAIAGLVAPRAGRVELAGRDVTRDKVAARQAAGLGHVPEDRHGHGLVLDLSIEDNLALGREKAFVIDRGARRATAERAIRDLDVRPPDPTAITRRLSGGNQQKVVVARELTRPGLRALVAAQPTRGVDIAAQALIHDRLRGAAAAGAAVLIVSADLDELLAICHRIAVLHRGRIAGELGGDALRSLEARVKLGTLMTGGAV
jgi:simple sugar transport system ATP-binding protein